MPGEMDERETKRIWQVAGKISGNEADNLKVFRIGGQIIARIIEWSKRVDGDCAPGTSEEEIDKVLQAHENSEERLEALFRFIDERVEEAFRYGYYAAVEDGEIKP